MWVLHTNTIKDLMQEERFQSVNEEDKAFICRFTGAMEDRGYTFGGVIGSGFCWGKYMIVFTKAHVKTKKVVARIYIREQDIVLRLFFNNITRHGEYILKAPAHIQEVFMGEYADCQHCSDDENGVCRFRKSYNIGDKDFHKCNGRTFEIYNPSGDRLDDYLNLFDEFYPAKKTAV